MIEFVDHVNLVVDVIERMVAFYRDHLGMRVTNNLMAVDTHVYRVAHRLGLSDAKTAVKCEEELSKKFETDLHLLHQAVLFGRYRCKALNPECEACFMKAHCKTTQTFKVNRLNTRSRYRRFPVTSSSSIC